MGPVVGIGIIGTWGMTYYKKFYKSPSFFIYVQCQKSFITPWAGMEIKSGLLANIFLGSEVLECPFPTRKNPVHYLFATGLWL